MSKNISKINKNYLALQIIIFSCWVFIIVGAIIFQLTWEIGAIAIIIVSYVAAFVIVIYVETYFFQNKRTWLRESIYIILICFPFVIESLIHYMRGKKTDKITKKILTLINSEEIPLFIVFGSFLNFHLKGNFRTSSIEMGIYKEDLHKGLIIRLSHLGFNYINCYKCNYDTTHYNFKYNGVKVNLYILENGKPFKSYDFFLNYINIYPVFKISMGTYSYQDCKFLGPKDAPEYFKHYFGKNWEYPDLSKNLFCGPSTNVGERRIKIPSASVVSKK